jgi:hypothetical protein
VCWLGLRLLRFRASAQLHEAMREQVSCARARSQILRSRLRTCASINSWLRLRTCASINSWLTAAHVRRMTDVFRDVVNEAEHGKVGDAGHAASGGVGNVGESHANENVAEGAGGDPEAANRRNAVFDGELNFPMFQEILYRMAYEAGVLTPKMREW